MNSKYVYVCDDCGIDLGEGLAKSASSAAFTLTIDSVDRYLGRGLGEGLTETTSLTTFTLTINGGHRFPLKDWIKGLAKGLAKTTSLTSHTNNQQRIPIPA